MGIESGEPQPWPWPDELDALIAAPAFHKNLFENNLVRYLEVIIRPGDFVPVNTHRWPSVIYVRSTSDFIRRDGEGRVMFDSRKAGAPPRRQPSNGWDRCRPIPSKMSARQKCTC
jgi:hypothetical protein